MLIFSRRKATPVKNTENVQAALRKDDQSAAVMSFSTLNDGLNGTNGGTHITQLPPNNIYENIHDNSEDDMYDAPYEQTESNRSHRSQNGSNHYESSPVSRSGNGAMVTINGVAVR